MEDSTENKMGFQRGLNKVYAMRTAEEYDRCLKEVKDVCMSTEVINASQASYYNKRRGACPLSVAERARLTEVFAKYGVTDWQGVE